MKEITNPTFIVFLSADDSNQNEAERVVLLRQFIRDGPGPEITILKAAVLSPTWEYNFFMAATAESAEVITAAFAHCAGIFRVTILEAEEYSIPPDAPEANYCLLAWDHKATAGPAPKPEDVTLCMEIVLQQPGHCNRMLLLYAPTFGQADSYGAYACPGAHVLPLLAQSAGSYFTERYNTPQPAESTENAAIATSALLANSRPFYLINNSAEYVYYTDLAEGLNLTAKKQYVNPRTRFRVNGATYLWRYNYGDFEYYLSNDTLHILPATLKKIPSYFTLPTTAVNGSENAELSFDLSTNNDFNEETPLSTWLNDLLNTKKYDAAWPEDNYTGELLLAYQYWLSLLPAPPNKGNIKAATITGKYIFPGYVSDKGFSKEAFDEVYAQLLDECAFFETATDWFGINGIFGAINTRIANVGTNTLISVASLMQIPTEKSKVTTVLDRVFSTVSGLVSNLPEVGSAISAVINVTWTTTKLIIGNEEMYKPMQEDISNIAKLLNRYTEYTEKATRAQLNAIYGNWGKLKEFANAAMEGKINAKEFGMQTPSALQSTGKLTAPPVPDGYISAADAAWRYLMYQSLFATHYTPGCKMSLQSKIPNNPWNPRQGKYDFTWYLPAVFINSCRTKEKGYIVLDCSTGAPQKVKEDLFGPNSSLNIDPTQFFMGYNGWAKVIPLLKLGYAEDNPVISIGH